jgi:V/A-type H+-transporting ATPase subunit F
MYKIGIIGDPAGILCFSALGFTVWEATDATTAAAKLHEAAKSGEYAVLFVTEVLARQIGEDIARYKDAPLPAVTVIPGAEGGQGYGLAALRQAVERAVGTDILK